MTNREAITWSQHTLALAKDIAEIYQWGWFPLLADAMEDDGYRNNELLTNMRECPLIPSNLSVFELFGIDKFSLAYKILCCN